MKKNLVRLGLVWAAVMLCGCARLEERTLYRAARRVLEEQVGGEEPVVPAKRHEAVLSVGKNAARVDLPYYRGESGGQPAGSYTLWFKRVRMRWELDRAFETPRY